MTRDLVHNGRDIEAGSHKDMLSVSSSASSSSRQFPTASTGRSKVHGNREIELQERKIRSTGNKGEGQFSDRLGFDLAPPGSRPWNTAGYGLRLRHLLPWFVNDVKQSTPMQDEDKLQTQEPFRSLKLRVEEVEAEVAEEQGEWAKEPRGLRHCFDETFSDKTESKPRE